MFGKAEGSGGGAGRCQKGQQHGAKSIGAVTGMYCSTSLVDCAILICVFKQRKFGIAGCQLGKIIKLPSSC